MIIGAILGLLGSALPEILKIFKDYRDKKHEIEMLKLQMEYQREMADIRIQEARALATLQLDAKAYEFAEPTIKPTGFKLADSLQAIASFYNSTVRPTLTYLVVVCWLMVKYAQFYIAGGDFQALLQCWTDADNEFVSAVVLFWFGGRALNKVFGRK